jgi:uncharacterized caspase-like protein
MSKNWAITIGINQYDNLKPLQYAKTDAEAVRNFFLNEMRFENVYYFSDDSPPIKQDRGPAMRSQPTYGVLSRFLNVRFEQPFLQPGDNLWFFFAGHGKRYQNRDYLMPSDVDPLNIERTAISINQITERLRRCGADNVILILDACRNEGERDGQGIGSEKQKGVITIFSCSPNERSYEIDELQHGSFTYALLEGLRIKGEGNCATVKRLNHYLCNQVPALNNRYKKPEQTPYIIPEPLAKQYLILLPKQANDVDVNILKNQALDAEVKDKRELAKQLWIRVLAASSGDMEAIEAIERIALRSNVSLPLTQPVFPESQITPSRSGEDVSLSITPLQDLSEKNRAEVVSKIEELVKTNKELDLVESELKSRRDPNVTPHLQEALYWLSANPKMLAKRAGNEALNSFINSINKDDNIELFYFEIQQYLELIYQSIDKQNEKLLQLSQPQLLFNPTVYEEALNAIKKRIPETLNIVARQEIEKRIEYLKKEIT